MSAICGAVGTDGRPFEGRDLDGVLDVLRPLGPHGEGTWAGDAGRCGVAVAAVLRRRTPEDAADAQLLVSRDGATVVVADLRLDNRRELARALSVPDRLDVADSAIVLAAYERWGPDCLDRLVGAYAIAVVDRRRGAVLLARDHIGTRPLVIHERRGVVAFASNALSLTGFEGVGHRLDEERAKEVVALLYRSERTFVDGVRWVAPGGSVWIDTGGAHHRLWWDPDPDEVVDLGSSAAHAEALRAVFDEAVASQLRTTGRVGAHASGGLDSTSVAATAARLLAPEPLRTYTSVPPPGESPPVRDGWTADESPLVRDLAARYPNIRPTFLHVRGAALFDGRYERAWELGGSPPRNPGNVLWDDAIDEEAAADGIGALLTGERGNYVFSADGPGWLAALLRARRFGQLAHELWGERRAKGALAAMKGLAGPLLPGWVHELRATRSSGHTRAEEWIGATALRPELAGSLAVEARERHLDPRRWSAQRSLFLVASATGSTQADQRAATEAIWGLDHRDPTADRRVLGVGMTQPEWARRHDGVTRAVARRAMADRLVPAIADRTERGEQLPDWLDRMTDARDEITTELQALRDHPLSRHLVDVARLDGLLQRWPDPGRAADREVVHGYHLAMLRALLVSRYLRWFEERARHAPVERC